MSDHSPTLDLTGLVVDSVEVVPAGSLDAVGYGHGAPELGASCWCNCAGGLSFSCHVTADSAVDMPDDNKHL
jgi:hypothetical protein